MRLLPFFERGPRVVAFLFSLRLLALAACEPTQVEPAYYGALTVSVAARRAPYDATTGSATITDGQTQSVVLLLNKTASTAPPGVATQPTPAVRATGLSADAQLSWYPAGALKSDSLKYDVVLYESNNPRATTSTSAPCSATAAIPRCWPRACALTPPTTGK
ncbi:MAG: hypothetical protein ACRYFR_03555 [Janthinobacterium lividum]